ncbi:MAG: hypothetical protein IKZ54_09080 [Bacteroidales bacterium]|nr:hypothetical protein [Bacteroidales bacterium]
MTNKKITVIFCIILTFCVVLTSCKKKAAQVKVAKPDLTEEQVKTAKNVEINILRYEQDLFNMDTKNMAAGFKTLYGKYPENIIANGAWNNTAMLQSIKGFISDPVIKEIYKDAEAKYRDLSDFENQIIPALTLYLTHFPDERTPGFCTLVSGIDFQMPSVFGYENTIFVCLDMYMGKDYKQYGQAGMPKYIAARCEPKYMATDCFSKALVYRHLPDKTLVTLLDNMVDAGKKMLFTQTMFPNVPAQDILGYSKEQYDWATSHESSVWHYLVEKNLVYDNTENVIRRMIDETPFTRDFGNDSPGRLGYFIGFQIVQSYMKNHPGTTLKELMKMTDSQKFLKDSGYKPK